jgi:hypothetical protein
MFRPKIAAMAAALTMTGVIPAFAQLNTVEKHPTMTGIAAGVATHAALKRAAANAKAHHKKLNWAERHPTLTSLGAGMATHHYLKKAAEHKEHAAGQ